MFFTGLAKFIQIIINIFAGALSVLLALFPKSPFQISLPSEFNQLVSVANYFLPISECIVVMELWLVSVGIYYLYVVWARFIKLIE